MTKQHRGSRGHGPAADHLGQPLTRRRQRGRYELTSEVDNIEVVPDHGPGAHTLRIHPVLAALRGGPGRVPVLRGRRDRGLVPARATSPPRADHRHRLTRRPGSVRLRRSAPAGPPRPPPHRTSRGRRRPGRRGRAEIHALDRRPIRVPPRHRPEHRLAQRGRPAVDVATQQVRVVRLRLVRRAHPRARTRSRKPGAKRSICASMRSRHVHRRAVRHVAVAPQGVLARRRPGRVDHAGLRHQHEGLLGVPPAPARPPPSAPPRRTCRRRGRSPCAGRPRPATAPGRRGPSPPCRCPGPGGSAPRAGRPGGRAAARPARRTPAARCRAAPRAPAEARPVTSPTSPVCTTPPSRRSSFASPLRDGRAAARHHGPAGAVAERRRGGGRRPTSAAR